MNIKCLPARYGDSFLINICDGTKQYNILIDCGLKDTCTEFIKNQLVSIKKIDLLVLTHIDDDHIKGAIELFQDADIIDNIVIDNIWFNDLYKITEGKLKKNIKSDLSNNGSIESGKFDQEVSYKQAKCLANYILESKHSDNWNKGIGIISCDDNYYKELYPIGREVKIVLLSPSKERIEELFSKWCEKSNIDKDKLVIDNKTLNSFYSFYINSKNGVGKFDEECSGKIADIETMAEKEYSVKNTSNDASIAFFIETKKNKVLFLGDSNSKDIEKSLKQYMKDKKLQKIKFDLIKVSHHGSKNNISNGLLELLECDKYVISTNGEIYNHPDLECLSKIIVKQQEYKEIVFNYRNKKVLKALNNEEYKKKYKYSLIMPSENKPIIMDIEV